VPDISSSTILILFIATVGLLALAVGYLLGISRRLARIEVLLAAQAVAKPEDSREPTVEESSAGGAFEAFLSEDPNRRKMVKKDQFAAYRSWRQAKGMNWSRSGDS
jgi:hypothetical protein